MAKKKNSPAKRKAITVDEMPGLVKKYDDRIKGLVADRNWLRSHPPEFTFSGFHVIVQMTPAEFKRLYPAAPPLDHTISWIRFRDGYRKDDIQDEVPIEKVLLFEFDLNMERIRTGKADTMFISPSDQQRYANMTMDFVADSMDCLIRTLKEDREMVLQKIEEIRQNEEYIKRLEEQHAIYAKTHFVVANEELFDRNVDINTKAKLLMDSGKEKLVIELINVFNGQYNGDVDEKVLDIIDRVLDLCEVQNTKKRVGEATEAVIDSLEKVHIIETFLRETSLIEQDLSKGAVYKSLWESVTSKDEALAKLRELKISKEDILLDKILKSRSEGILVQNTYKTKNFSKTLENMPTILSQLKKLYPNKEEVAILEILKNAATTVLEINNDTIEQTVNFLTDIFDEEVVRSDNIQEFIIRNKELFTDLNLVEKNGRFSIYSTDKSLEKKVSLQLAKLLIKDKPSQMFSYVDGHSNLTLKTDIINAYGRKALSKFAVLLLEEDASIMGINIEDCRLREGKICSILDKLKSENFPSLKDEANLEKIKNSLNDVAILRAENNRNQCMTKNQRFFCKFGKNYTQERAYEENIKTLLENYGPDTVASMLSTNLAVLDLKPTFLKAILNKAADFQIKAKFARSLNSVMYGLSGKSNYSFSQTGSGTQRRGFKKQKVAGDIQLTGIKPYDIDMEDLSDDEKKVLDSIFNNIISSADISEDKLIIGGTAKYGYTKTEDYVAYIKDKVLFHEFDEKMLDNIAAFIPEKERPDFYLASLFLDLNFLAKNNKCSSNLEIARKLVEFEKEKGVFEKLHEFRDCIGTDYITFFDKFSSRFPKVAIKAMEGAAEVIESDKSSKDEVRSASQAYLLLDVLQNMELYKSGKEVLDGIYERGYEAISSIILDSEKEADTERLRNLLFEVHKQLPHRGSRPVENAKDDWFVSTMVDAATKTFSRNDISKEETDEIWETYVRLEDSKEELTKGN